MALNVLHPMPRMRPARDHRKKCSARFCGSTAVRLIIDSQVATVSCVSSEMVGPTGISNCVGPSLPSHGPPQASPKALASRHPKIRSFKAYSVLQSDRARGFRHAFLFLRDLRKAASVVLAVVGQLSG
jgi:hypothetical protein